ncbi:hypothetical protein [Enterococcus alishanensis]
MRYYKVSEEARNYARKVLRHHNYEAKQIKVIEESLRHPWRESDENIGGSHVSSNQGPQAIEMERVWTNDEFVTAARHVELVRNMLSDLPSDYVEVIKYRYLSDKGESLRRAKELPSWVKVSQQMNLSEEACRKKDTIAATILAKMLKLK